MENIAPQHLGRQHNAWMSSPDIAQIFAALPDGSLRFVGGCVRNALWGEPVGDIDLATTLKPKDVMDALNKAGIKSVPTGIEHGTITAVIEGTPFEITSLRRDVETNGRRAVVAFSQDWAEDAQRRDLTVNALYADLDGKIYDPTGRGLGDIAAKRFAFVGDADARCKEDYLRILRFFRFIAHYGGKEKLDPAALKACRENKAGLRKLSAERVWSELKKLLSAKDPSRALRIMLINEILEVILYDASNVDGLAHLINLEQRENIAPDPLLRLMSMCAREPLQVALLCKRLKMSNAETKRLRAWAEDDAALGTDMEERAKLGAIYTSGKQVIMDRVILRAAGEPNGLSSSRWMSLADLALGWTRPVFPIDGKDLAGAGVPKGPQMGKAMKALETLWVRSGFRTEKPQLLAALKILGY